jgi:site-specific DNA-methyltransferase (adenine-specific)
MANNNDNNITYNIEEMNTINTDITKLSKSELLEKCKEIGITKCKSKSKSELIILLENPPAKKQMIELIIEEEENEKKEEKEKDNTDETINKIYNEDCILGMKKIKDESVDIIICDPPYNIGKDFGNNSDKQKMDEYLLWCDSWIAECLRILKPQGTLYIYGFSEILAFIRTRITCNVRWLVWHYTNKVTPSLNFWQRTHESILCCYKDKPIFNRDDVREPYTETFLKNAAGKVRKPTVGRFSNGDKETTYTAHEGGALPRDVIKTPALAGGAGKKERVDHPTQKPLNLCDTLIKASLNKSSPTLLVVPFVGSGSECVSAKKNNVNFIGFEINSDYINTANERLAEINNK